MCGGGGNSFPPLIYHFKLPKTHGCWLKHGHESSFSGFLNSGGKSAEGEVEVASFIRTAGDAASWEMASFNFKLQKLKAATWKLVLLMLNNVYPPPSI